MINQEHLMKRLVIVPVAMKERKIIHGTKMTKEDIRAVLLSETGK